MTCRHNASPPNAIGRWFPPGTPVSSTRKLISSSSFHRIEVTLAVVGALHPNKPKNLTPTGADLGGPKGHVPPRPLIKLA